MDIFESLTTGSEALKLGEQGTAVREIDAQYNEGYLTPKRTWKFGDEKDGVVESAATVFNPEDQSESGLIEIGYYYGEAKPKPIIKISSQVGCPMECDFCDLGDISFKRNLTRDEMVHQYLFMHELTAQIGARKGDIKHKVNIAGSGDPLFNPELVPALEAISKTVTHGQGISFKVSTVFPRTKVTIRNFKELARFAGEYNDSVQMQLSVISLSEEKREKQVGQRVLTLEQVAEMAAYWRSHNPMRKQFNLSLILDAESELAPEDISGLLPPEHFRFRFRPYVATENGKNHGLKTISTERLSEIKKSFSAYGYYSGDEATPTPTEATFGLASNVTRRRAADS